MFGAFEPAIWGGIDGVDNVRNTKPIIDDVLQCKMNGMCNR